MRSVWTRCLSWCSGIGFLTLALVPVSAMCAVGQDCGRETTASDTAFGDNSGQASVGSASIAPKSKDKHATLILNCPATARVTIGGRVTHASGATRQYCLTFRDDLYKGWIEVRLRDNDEKVTYDVDWPFECRDQGRLVLTITRDRMRPTPDKPEKKCEEDVTDGCQKPKAATVTPAKAESPSTLQQTITQYQKLRDSEQAKVDDLEKELLAKRTRWEAAVGIRKRLQDAHRLKITEVDLAKSDPAAVLNAKRLELVKLETDEQRATEVEGEARADFVEATKQVDAAKVRVRDITSKLDHWRWTQSIDQQTKAVERATSDVQRFAGLVDTKAARQKLMSETLDTERKKPGKNSTDPLVAYLVEIEQTATRELEASRKSLEDARERLRDEQARWDAVKSGTLKLDSK